MQTASSSSASTMGRVLVVMVGFLGQALFSTRFRIQWIMSERARRSVMPTASWYFSLAGGIVLLAYAIYRRDPGVRIWPGHRSSDLCLATSG